ncbi:adenosylmethionine decarboxylase [Bacteroidia bacterium]|nr:adenosylmethionine decarboxylase [Bacteroidia bacterium]MDB4107253.1 adenosylmethionine decarboxylase [Bacteroidia bacterium]
MTHLGFHYIWDIYNCNYTAIDKIAPVASLMTGIVQISQLTKLGESFNQFAPHGVTGVYLLEESHLSAHSWPENNYIAIDLFSCMQLNNLAEIEKLISIHLGDVRIDYKKVERGKL